MTTNDWALIVKSLRTARSCYSDSEPKACYDIYLRMSKLADEIEQTHLEAVDDRE